MLPPSNYLTDSLASQKYQILNCNHKDEFLICLLLVWREYEILTYHLKSAHLFSYAQCILAYAHFC